MSIHHKTYKCIARIIYEFEIEANDPNEAEICVFEILADDITTGIIRTDYFISDGFPMLVGVEVEEKRE